MANLKVAPAPAPARTATMLCRLKKVTKGAYQFEEVDENGEPTTVLSGGIYLRKGAVKNMAEGDTITVTVTY